MSRDWKTKAFDECVTRLNCTKVPKSAVLGNGLFPIVSQEQDLISGYWENAGDVLCIDKPVVVFGDHTRVLKYVDFDFVIGADGVVVLRPMDEIYTRYFYYFLLGNPVSSLGYSRHYRLLRNIEICYPPLPEQKRIVAILDEAFAAIDTAIANTEKNLKNALELFESYLNVKLLKVASAEAKTSLSEISELIVDCEHKTAPTQDIGYPSIRTPNIGKGYLILDNVKRVSEETYLLWTQRAKPLPGDLILAREAPAGNVGIIPDGEMVCLGQRTVLVRPISTIVNSSYLAFLLLHPIMQHKLLLHSTGATVQHVNMRDIRSLGVAELPALAQQESDVSSLNMARSAFFDLEKLCNQKLTSLKNLKQSILQKAFTGELTSKSIDHLDLSPPPSKFEEAHP